MRDSTPFFNTFRQQVRIGNWCEESIKADQETKELLEKFEKKELLSSKFRQVREYGRSSVSGNKVQGNVTYAHKVQLSNTATDTFVCVEFEKGNGVASKKDTSLLVRNVFKLMPCASLKQSDPLCFGDTVKLCTIDGEFCLTQESEKLSTLMGSQGFHSTRFSKELNASESFWKVQYPFEDMRLEHEGIPIQSDSQFILFNEHNGRYLLPQKAKLINLFGDEYVLCTAALKHLRVDSNQFLWTLHAFE